MISKWFSEWSRPDRNTNVQSDSGYTIFVFESEFLAMASEAKRMPSTEIGGDLYGSFTHGTMPVIWLASGPGPRCRLNQLDFQQDPDFTTGWAKFLMENYGIQYIGSWHSHHMLGLRQPSEGDVRAAQRYAQRHQRQTTLEIIANHDNDSLAAAGQRPLITSLAGFFYPDAQRHSWVPARFKIMNGVSPLREILRTQERTFGGSEWAGVDWQTCKVTLVGGGDETRKKERFPEEQLPVELLKQIQNLCQRGYSVTGQKIDNNYAMVFDLGAQGLILVGLEEDNGRDYKVTRAVYSFEDTNYKIDLSPAEPQVSKSYEFSQLARQLIQRADEIRRATTRPAPSPYESNGL